MAGGNSSETTGPPFSEASLKRKKMSTVVEEMFADMDELTGENEVLKMRLATSVPEMDVRQMIESETSTLNEEYANALRTIESLRKDNEKLRADVNAAYHAQSTEWAHERVREIQSKEHHDRFTELIRLEVNNKQLQSEIDALRSAADAHQTTEKVRVPPQTNNGDVFSKATPNEEANEQVRLGNPSPTSHTDAQKALEEGNAVLRAIVKKLRSQLANQRNLDSEGSPSAYALRTSDESPLHRLRPDDRGFRISDWEKALKDKRADEYLANIDFVGVPHVLGYADLCWWDDLDDDQSYEDLVPVSVAYATNEDENVNDMLQKGWDPQLFFNVSNFELPHDEDIVLGGQTWAEYKGNKAQRDAISKAFICKLDPLQADMVNDIDLDAMKLDVTAIPKKKRKAYAQEESKRMRWMEQITHVNMFGQHLMAEGNLLSKAAIAKLRAGAFHQKMAMKELRMLRHREASNLKTALRG